LLLSFVIPTYNRVKLLAKTVPALANLATAEGVGYEVIFVDNGSTDSTPAFLNDAVSRYPDRFRHIRIAPTGGPSAPRNTGIRAARGEVLIIIDDDFLPDNDIVLRYSEFHAKYPDQHHAALGAGYVPQQLLTDPLSWFHNYDFNLPQDAPLTYLQFWTCNVSLKRDFMLKAGMFDENFLFYEDLLCGYQLQRSGMQLHMWKTATGQHWHQLTIEGLAARALFMGRWQYSFLERVGRDPTLLILMHVLSTELPFRVMVKRAIGRLAFRVVDNPLVTWILEMRGARRATRRSKLTDYYSTTIFHRNMINGYLEAKRSAKAGRPLNLMRLESRLADRGER
jgi:glycosyltransferase involved in cell wall biosynthesis